MFDRENILVLFRQKNTLLALCFHLGDDVKYRIFPKHFFQKEQRDHG